MALSELNEDHRGHRPVSETAARLIEEHLRSLKPGEKVPSERRLAEALNISRPAVREALRVLETSGHIYAAPGKGRFMSEEAGLRSSEVTDWLNTHGRAIASLNEIGALLESRAVEYMSPAQARQAAVELKGLIAKTRRMVKAGKFREAAALDPPFHRILSSFCTNRPLRDLAERLTQTAQTFGEEIYTLPGFAEHSLTQHEQIVDALADGDVRTASMLVATHLSTAARYAARLTNQRPRR